MRHFIVLAALACASIAHADEAVIKSGQSVWDTTAPGACAKAIYPKASQRNEETGWVGLTFHIGIDGRVSDSEVFRSSKFPLLDEASRELIMSCVFPLKANKSAQIELQKVAYQWRLEAGKPVTGQ